MPVYKAEKYIELSIQSILKQTYSDFELLLIDDCGNDRSIEIADSFNDDRIKILTNKVNKGIASSRNKGIKYANGYYIALMDDDDICPVNRFQKQIEFLDSNKEIDVVGGRYEMINEKNQKIKVFSEPLNNPQYIKAYMMFYNPMANGTTMIKNDFLQKNKILYQDNWFGMEDYRFWIDCSLSGNITNLSEILLSWRLTKSNETTYNMTNNITQRKIKYAEIQNYAIEKNGFNLKNEDKYFLNKMFPEDIKTSEVDKKDIEHLYEIFTVMLKQACEFEMKNKKEIELCIKKMFSLRIENSNVWKKNFSI